MSILEDLWLGKIALCDKPFAKDGDYAKTIERVVKTEQSLLGRLPADGKELLLEFEKDESQLMCISEQDAFVRGFRLGAKIMLDVLEEERK